MKDGKYSIELLREGEGHDIEIVLAREDNLDVAHTFYGLIADKYPDQLAMLCDRARVLARSDLLETAPSFSLAGWSAPATRLSVAKTCPTSLLVSAKAPSPVTSASDSHNPASSRYFAAQRIAAMSLE